MDYIRLIQPRASIGLQMLIKIPNFQNPSSKYPDFLRNYKPRRFNSFLISPNSLPVCPETELFSCARRIK